MITCWFFYKIRYHQESYSPPHHLKSSNIMPYLLHHTPHLNHLNRQQFIFIFFKLIIVQLKSFCVLAISFKGTYMTVAILVSLCMYRAQPQSYWPAWWNYLSLELGRRIDLFWVPKTLTFKTRLSAKPFLWKWVKHERRKSFSFQWFNPTYSVASLGMKQRLGATQINGLLSLWRRAWIWNGTCYPWKSPMFWHWAINAEVTYFLLHI